MRIVGLLIAIVAGFASGVGVRSIFSFGWEPVAFALLLAALMGAAAFMKPRLAYSLGAIFFLFVAFGMVRANG